MYLIVFHSLSVDCLSDVNYWLDDYVVGLMYAVLSLAVDNSLDRFACC